EAGRGEAEVLVEQSVELEERLVVETDVVEFGRADACLAEAVGRSSSGKPGVVLLTREALLLSGSDDLAVAHHAGCRVVVEGREAEDGRHEDLLELLAVARRVDGSRATLDPQGAPAVAYLAIGRAAHDAAHEAERCDDEVEDQRQDDPGVHPAQALREPHPDALDRVEQPRGHQAGEHQQDACRPEQQRRQRVPAPPADAREQQKDAAHDETESPEFARRVSDGRHQKMVEMKGATAEPWVSATKVPNSTSTTKIGPSHHFFLSRMNDHSSDTNEIPASRFCIMVPPQL